MTPETLTVANVCAALKAVTDEVPLNEWKITIHTDGSGTIDDVHNGTRAHTFDNLAGLLGFVVANIGWKTNACQLGLHPQCIYGPSIPCTCECHKAKDRN